MQTLIKEAMAEYRDERERWIGEHGSERLRLAVKLGLLEKSDNVYREERRAHEKRGWLLENELPAGFRVQAIHNPSLEGMRMLDVERQKDQTVELVYVSWVNRIPGQKWGKMVALSAGREALRSRWIGLYVYRWTTPPGGRAEIPVESE